MSTVYNGGVYRSAAQINDAMLRVYGHMTAAVMNSMLVSAVVSNSAAVMAFFFTGIMQWIVIFAPLAAILVISFGIHRLTYTQALAVLHVFAALMGLSMASLFAVFTLGSIVSAFMGAAVLFGTMSIYGYFTKKDLTSLGQFMFVGLIAIVIASVINVFIGSSVAAMVISALAIVVFMGLTASDTQQIRETVSVDTAEHKSEIIAALSLYLNFINIFTALLQLFGNRDE